MVLLANFALAISLLSGMVLGYFAGAIYGIGASFCVLFFPRLSLLIMRTIPFTKGLVGTEGTPNSVFSMLAFYGILFVLITILQLVVAQLDKGLRPMLSHNMWRFIYRPAGSAAFAFAFFLAFSLLFSTFTGLMPKDYRIHESLAARASARGLALMDLPDFGEEPWEELMPGVSLIPPEPESQYTVNLPPTSPSCSLQPELENEMVILVNMERSKRGLKPLTTDPLLTRMARDHSLDMCQRRYFSHYSPDGEDVADRAEKAGLRYQLVGENLALAPDLMSAHEGLMESPGHRQNILSARYSRIGIGIIRDPSLGLFVTQNFAD